MAIVAASMHAAKFASSRFQLEDLSMMFWAVSRREAIKDAWILFAHAKRSGWSREPTSLGVLCMESEQRGLIDAEIGLLIELGSTTQENGCELGFGANTKYVTAMCLAGSF
eukprot:gnl/TRDRNA2_/TRDRNA2_173302_c11_seq1.p1 gnl/TRDRNA2_/TRDRNA2_173302_c11~~gnl/TRDRNA2_/TRDRNA2_173302_c11_seq1.p1  ORF type:complete len:124 (+),score=18.46 gnl/TRDRNA2_/TRDRNA2_173302_c11_seq1:42-374(+)